ncbi:MAG: DUF3108 domain-containing protein, partial [Saprospiraceae bacterium]|nr:DUF3108 domain-containing protein [Saprospiraceae bacterium]
MSKYFSLGLGLFLMAFTTSGDYWTVPATIEYAYAPALQYDPCGNTNSTFQHAEKLTYKIYYNWNFVWIAAGEVTFQVFDEGDQYHYQARGETYDSYEWFFTVKDEYD